MLTRLGRFSEWIRALMLGAAVVTGALWPPANFYSLSGLASAADRATGTDPLEFPPRSPHRRTTPVRHAIHLERT